MVTLGGTVPSWERAWGKTHFRAKTHVLANRVDQIDAYVKELGIEAETLVAAINYARIPPTGQCGH